MNSIIRFAICTLTLVVASACGLQEGDDGYVDIPGVITPVDDGGTEPTYAPAPFRSLDTCVLEFSRAYVSDAPCGEARGNLPLDGFGWDSGPAILDPDDDGYLGVSLESVPAGTYELSYVGFQECDSATPNEAWAQYGDPEQLAALSPEDQAFVSCNWWDGGRRLDVDNPSCGVRVMIDDLCTVVAAGNMAGYAGE